MMDFQLGSLRLAQAAANKTPALMVLVQPKASNRVPMTPSRR